MFWQFQFIEMKLPFSLRNWNLTVLSNLNRILNRMWLEKWRKKSKPWIVFEKRKWRKIYCASKLLSSSYILKCMMLAHFKTFGAGATPKHVWKKRVQWFIWIELNRLKRFSRMCFWRGLVFMQQVYASPRNGLLCKFT